MSHFYWWNLNEVGDEKEDSNAEEDIDILISLGPELIAVGGIHEEGVGDSTTEILHWTFLPFLGRTNATRAKIGCDTPETMAHTIPTASITWSHFVPNRNCN